MNTSVTLDLHLIKRQAVVLVTSSSIKQYYSPAL